jgi:ubiquinone/menaquinone biosynthesis C-methylase UbiE
MNPALVDREAEPDLIAVKARQQKTWASGDYAVIGTTLQIVGEQLCESMNLSAGSRVLDIAAGNGNATLAAARRFCTVTSTDYVGALLERGRERAAAERLDVEFRVADAEALPFDDGSFDAVVSTFGIMFAPDQARAAAEAARVCRSGGVIGLSNWTPGSFIGQMFTLVSHYLPPAPGMQSPMRWGSADAVRGWFETVAADITIVPRTYTFRYLHAEHFIEVFRGWYGPIHQAFIAAGPRAGVLAEDLRDLLNRRNVALDGSLAIPSAYVDVLIRRA